MLRLRALGAAEIAIDATRIDPGSPRKFALLLRLAADPGLTFPRPVLRELVFADLPDKNARHSLRETLYQLRQVGVSCNADTKGITLTDPVSSDVAELLCAGQPTSEQLRAAENGLLPAYVPVRSEAYAEWLEGFRARLTIELCRSLSRAIDRARKVSNWNTVADIARACLALDPSHEEATLALAETVAVAGSKVRAVDMLNEYATEVGKLQSDLQVPASVIRRRITERLGERSQTGLTLPFAGREAELLLINERFELAWQGHPQCVVIAGEAGIGKSRLADEFCTQASLRGARVEHAAMQPHDAHRPLGVLADIVPRLLKLPGSLGCAPESIVALKRLTGESDTPTGVSEPSGHEVIASSIRRAIVDLIDAIATESLLVLVVDDAHWSDELSKTVLASLTSGKADRRLLSILTTRNRVDQAVVGRIADRTLAISLRPLATAAVTQVLQELDVAGLDTDRELQNWMATTSGGNPFYLRSLVSHFQTTDERFVVPPTLSALLDQQLIALSSDALSVLSMSVALGRHSNLANLVRALEIPHIQLQGAIRDLELHCFLSLVEQRIEPAHWLISEAVIRSASPIAKRLLHRRVAEVLESEAGATPSPQIYWDCAEHWMLADDQSRAGRAMQACAAHSLKIGRPREAAEILLRAGSLVEGEARANFVIGALRIADGATELEVVLQGLEFAQQNAIAVTDESIELAGLAAQISVREDVEGAAERLRKWLRPTTPWENRLRAATTCLILADQNSQPSLAREAFEAVTHDIEQQSTSIPLLVFLMIFHSRFDSVTQSIELAEMLLRLLEDATPMAKLDLQRKVATAFYRAGDFRRAADICETTLVGAKAMATGRLQFALLSLLVGIYADLELDELSKKRLEEFNELALESDNFYASMTCVCVNAEHACLHGRADDARRWLAVGRSRSSRSPTDRAERYHRAFGRWADLISGSPIRFANVVAEMTSHHVPKQEVGDVSDVEISVAVNWLAGQSANSEARDLIQRYVDQYRRIPGPFGRALQLASAKVGWPTDP